MRPNAMRANDDGGGGGGGNRAGCNVTAIAVAGPININAVPWIFPPILPSVTLQGGTPYTFYVATQTGVGCPGGGDGGWGSGDGGGDGGDH